ncbi:MAG: M48 family metalloprotease [Myxococcota bacterium]
MHRASSRRICAFVIGLNLLNVQYIESPGSAGPMFLSLSERREAELGETGLAVLSVAPGIWRDKRVSPRVERVGKELAKLTNGPDYRYRFFILDTEDTNAFALPGGFVFVSRGLLATLETEDELAGILGHEIGHIAARHADERESLETGQQALVQAANAFRRLFGIDSDSPPRFFERALASHSRAQEREADRIGVVLAVSLGYDGRALADVLRRIDTADRARSVLQTHPATPERLALIETLAEELTAGPRRPDTTQRHFLRALDGLPLGPSLHLGVQNQQRFFAPDPGYAITFPDSWKIQIGFEGTVATAPDWKAVVSVYPVPDARGDAGVSADPDLGADTKAKAGGGPGLEVGSIDVISGHRVQVGVEDRMRSMRAQFVAGERAYEIAGLWSLASDRRHRAEYAQILNSLVIANCDTPLRFTRPTLRVHSGDDGKLEKRRRDQSMRRYPARCTPP